MGWRICKYPAVIQAYLQILGYLKTTWLYILMDKIKNLLKIQADGETFSMGNENHILLEKLRCFHVSTSSVHNQHENFFGTALRIRQRLNN